MLAKEIFKTNLTDSKTTDVEIVGSERSSGGNIYRWVLNGETAVDLVAGDVVFYKLSDQATMRTTVYKALTANLSVMAGVVKTTSLLRSTYGWVLVEGYTAGALVLGATTGGTDIAAGNYLKGVDSQLYAVRDAAVQPAYKNTLQILEAVGTTTSPTAALKKAYVRCL